MQFPCKKTCRERALPGCRTDCQKLQAWKDVREIEQKAKERETLLNGYICDACRAAKKGARRHDGRHIR